MEIADFETYSPASPRILVTCRVININFPIEVLLCFKMTFSVTYLVAHMYYVVQQECRKQFDQIASILIIHNAICHLNNCNTH